MKSSTKNRIFYDELIEPGYIIFQESLPNKHWFNSLYETFDSVIDKLSEEHASELRTAALEWLKQGDNDSYFCGTPPSFRDRSETEAKRNKLYLQYCLEFANSAVFTNTWIGKQPEMIKLITQIKEIEGICASLFDKVLKSIIVDYPILSKYYDYNRPLPIIMKLVRYNRDEDRFATDPHFDKSALSIIVDADDEKVGWRVGKGENCLLSKMVALFEYPEKNDDPNHCILFSGLCLKAVGVNIPPAPHYVMPVINKTYRHSLIAFLLVPNLKDTDKMITNAPYIHDIMKEIQ